MIQVMTETDLRTDDDDTMSGTEMVTIRLGGIRICVYEYGADQVVIDVDGEWAEETVRVRINDGEVYR
jgi:hypothetical protein